MKSKPNKAEDITLKPVIVKGYSLDILMISNLATLILSAIIFWNWAVCRERQNALDASAAEYYWDSKLDKQFRYKQAIVYLEAGTSLYNFHGVSGTIYSNNTVEYVTDSRVITNSY